jgi:hypothetical protein
MTGRVSEALAAWLIVSIPTGKPGNNPPTVERDDRQLSRIAASARPLPDRCMEYGVTSGPPQARQDPAWRRWRASDSGAGASAKLTDPDRFDKMPRAPVQGLLTMESVRLARSRLARQFSGFISTVLPAV